MAASPVSEGVGGGSVVVFPCGSSNIRAISRLTPDGLLLLAAYGTACYVLGLVTGARVIPWLVDQGWFPVRRHSDGRDDR